MRRKRGPAYHMLYVDTVDQIAHLHGPDAPHTAAEIEAVLGTLERQLHPALHNLGRPALLLLTADHGHIATNHRRAILLNRLAPDLVAAMRLGADAKPLAPVGSSRDFFVYLKPEQVAPWHERLSTMLAGRAEVYTTDELLAMGLFGPNVTPRLRERLGDLVILPYANETIWWDDKRFPLRHKGMHGGLSPAEAHTQFAALAYSG
jgi:predicted AlkP superfamily pyrophosphatase or phosphodiesterase